MKDRFLSGCVGSFIALGLVAIVASIYKFVIEPITELIKGLDVELVNQYSPLILILIAVALIGFMAGFSEYK